MIIEQAINSSIGDIRTILNLIEFSLDSISASDGDALADMLLDADMRTTNDVYWLESQGLQID